MFQGSTCTDDIPMVFSDKWKTPPLPIIPKKCILPVLEMSTLTTQHLFEYNFSLERKILEKIEEWKSVRFRKIDERERRITLREEVKRQQLKTEESKLKEQLTKVSYPSPDEIENSGWKDEIRESKLKIFSDPGSILKPTVISSKLDNQKIKANEALRVPKSKIKLADFENDSSDPFNTMELKTIDDLNLLEQILKSSIKENVCSNTPKYMDSNTEIILPGEETQQEFEKTYKGRQNEGELNSQDKSLSDGSIITTISLINKKNDETKTFIPEEMLSKSVPDIVSELEKELEDLTQRKINSQIYESSSQNSNENNRKKIETKKNYIDLPEDIRKLALNISKMGFPLDRVCRIAQFHFQDDKKIIEHLIVLTELMDLGFEEKNISDALFQFDNNKEKTLDFLINT